MLLPAEKNIALFNTVLVFEKCFPRPTPWLLRQVSPSLRNHRGAFPVVRTPGKGIVARLEITARIRIPFHAPPLQVSAWRQPGNKAQRLGSAT